MAINKTYKEQLERINTVAPSDYTKNQSINLLNQLYKKGVIPQAINELKGEGCVVFESTDDSGNYASISLYNDCSVIGLSRPVNGAMNVYEATGITNQILNIFINTIKEN